MYNIKNSFAQTLLWVGMLFPLYLTAQGVWEGHRSAFYKEEFKEITLKRDLVVVRYTHSNVNENGQRTNLSSWYAPFNPMLSPAEAVRKLNLPPTNGAYYFERVVLPAGTKLYMGQVADGNWKDGNLIPNGRSTGSIQYYIPRENLGQVQRIGEVFRNEVENYQRSVRSIPNTRYHKGNNDHNNPPPSGPSSQNPSYRIRENTNTQHIQEVSRQQGDFPGGVVVQPRAICSLSPETVQYNSQTGALIINGKYNFYPMLADEELAQLAGLAYLSQDKRLAAVSQDQFNNLSPNSTLALSLAEADKAMGWVAFGYNLDGFPLPDEMAAPGYDNPMIREQHQIRYWWMNWKKLFKIAQNQLNGIEPRLFMEFKEINFEVNPVSNQLLANALDIEINYQAFEYDEKGEKKFCSEKPEDIYPEIVAAIRHFKSNWAWYEKQFPELLKVRKIAETYAILKFLSAQGATPVGFEHLFQCYLSPIELPIAYDNYNNIQPNSPYVKGSKKALKALNWLPDWLISEEKEKHLCMLRLHLAMQSNDIKKISRYRKKMEEYLKPGNGKIAGLPAYRIKQIRENLPYYVANGVYAKLAFARKYKKDFPGLSKKQYIECVQYFVKATAIEPKNKALAEQLAIIYEEIGKPEKAKPYRLVASSSG